MLSEKPRHLCFPNYVIEIRKEKSQSATVRYSLSKCSCGMVRDGVGHGALFSGHSEKSRAWHAGNNDLFLEQGTRF